MPPADQDGKKTLDGSVPGQKTDAESDPVKAALGAMFGEGDDEFDWDKAIDEWDPTSFLTESTLPPEMAGGGAKNAPSTPPTAKAAKSQPPIGKPAEPVLSGAPDPDEPPALPPPALPPPPLESDAAPLPPPPVATAADAGFSLTGGSPPPAVTPAAAKSASSGEQIVTLDARQTSMLAALLKAPSRNELAPIVPGKLRNAPAVSDEDDYDIEIGASGSAAEDAAPAPSGITPELGFFSGPEPIAGLDDGSALPEAPLAPPIERPVRPAPVVKPAAAVTPREDSGTLALPPPPAAPVPPALADLPPSGLPAELAATPAESARSLRLEAEPPSEPEIRLSVDTPTPPPAELAQLVDPAPAEKPAEPAPVLAPVAAAPQDKPAPVEEIAATPAPRTTKATPAPRSDRVPAAVRDLPSAPSPRPPSRNPATAIVPRRLPLPSLDELPPLGEAAASGATLEAASRRHFLSVLDAEAQAAASGDKARAAHLALYAARQAESLREPADALDRYRQALELDAQSRPALRGTRRVLSWPGPTAAPDDATALLDRELEQSTPAEQLGLLLARAELVRAQGMLSDAKEGFSAITGAARKTDGRGPAKLTAQPGVMAALLGLIDLAVVQGAASELLVALDGILETYATHGVLRTALQIERARLDEVAGRDSVAATKFEALFGGAPGSPLSTGLGWLRTAVRLPRIKKDEPSPLQRAERALFETAAPLPTGLRAALGRRAAEAAPAADKLALLTRAAEQRDTLALQDLAQAQQQAGDLAGAAATYLRLAEATREPAPKSLAFTSAGEAFQRAGQLGAAKDVLCQALATSAGAGVEYDALAGRLLERTSHALGRPEDLLSLWREAARQPTEQAAYSRVLAARLLLAQADRPGSRDEALAELKAALAQRPDYAPAVALLSDALAQAGQPAEAAQVLIAAAAAMSEPLSRSDFAVRQAYREEAALLLERAGQIEDAARLLSAELAARPPQGAVQPASFVPALRWHVTALAQQLGGKADAQLILQVADVLRADAEQTPSQARAAALWFQRGVLLAQSHPVPAPDGGPVEDSWQRALAAEPMHASALLSLHLRALAAPKDAVAHSPLAHAVVAALRARLDASAGRPAAMLWALRLAAAQENEARDAAGALLTLRQLRAQVPEHASLLGLEDTLFVTAWRGGQALELLDRDIAKDPDLETQYALQMLAGEQLEQHNQPAQAAERFARALELRPGHPVARAALVRAYQTAGMLDALAKLTTVELKEATDITTRVAAFERQALLATLRGGDVATRSEQTLAAYRNILNVDANHHGAMRALERHFIAAKEWGELIHLYEQMGLTATDTAFAVHSHLDRARLRQKLVWQSKLDNTTLANELENDYRLALYRDRHCLTALRSLLTAALRRGELGLIAELSGNVAELCSAPGDAPGTEAGEGPAAAVFYTRSAEAMDELGRTPASIIATYQKGLRKFPEYLPGLRSLLHFAITNQEPAVAADCAEALAQAVHDPDEKYLSHMLAGVIAQDLLSDLPRARRAFRAGQQLLPEREEAFERLRNSFSSTGRELPLEEARELSALLVERLQHDGHPALYRTTLRLELSQLLAGPLGDRARAKSELHQALSLTPGHPTALYTLGKLHTDDKEWAQGAELLERYGKVEQRPAQLTALHLLLGEIYSEHLRDPQNATAQYTRVLSLQPHNQLALTRLSDLLLSQQKTAGALPILRRLVKLTDDKNKKIAYYHRIAALSEQTGDLRGALEALRLATEVDPMNLAAIGELARYYDRQSDVQSMRIHLDRAAARFRPLLRERPRDPAVYLSLMQIFLWRRTLDLAAMAAGAVVALGGTVPAELQAQIDKQPPRKEPTRDGLRDAGIDDLLFPPRVTPGLRALFKMLAEPFSKLYGSDSKKLAALGVDRRERLPRSGHPVRDLANKLAADLGVGDFDLYLTAAQTKDEDGKLVPLCTVEPTEPPSLIVTSSLIDSAPEAERRFFLGGLLKLLQSQLVLPLRLSPDDLGVLIGGLVRQFVPDYAPLGFAEKRIVNEATRQRRAIPSRLHPQLLPFAMECASAALDFEGIAESLITSSHHAGLLLCGNLAASVSALRRKGGERLVDDLLRFAVSDEFAELRRLVTGAAG